MTSDWLRQAMELQARGEHAAALSACQGASAGPRARFAAHALRAVSLSVLGRRTEALAELSEARALGPPSRQLLQLALDACQALGEPGLGCDFIDRALDTLGDRGGMLLATRDRLVGRMHLLSGYTGHLERVAQLTPHSFQARHRLATLYLDAHLTELASTELDAALALDSSSFEAWLARAAAHIEQEAAAGAMGALERARPLASTPADELRLALLLLRAGALGEAIESARQLLDRDPGHVQARLHCVRFALWRGEVHEARELLEASGPLGPRAERERAAIAFVEGDSDAALEHALRAIDHDPTDPEPHAFAAAALMRLGRHDAANQAVITATHRQGSGWLPALSLISVVNQAMGKATVRGRAVAAALAALGPVIGRGFDALDLTRDVRTSHVLGQLEAALERLSGNFSGDVTYLESGRAIRYHAAPLPARIACVRAAASIKARPWAYAIERIQALKARYPTSSLVHTHAAELYLWQGDFAACELECRKALAITESEESRWARVGLGAALMLQGREHEALEVFAASDERMPPGGPLRAYRGETLRRLGQLDAAEAELRAALADNPARVSAWINLALIARARGDDATVHDLYGRLAARLPELVGDVERAMRLRATPGTASGGDPGATFEALLVAMRGNRATSRITYFVDEGEARLAQACPLG